MKKIIYIFSILLISSSCAFHYGTMTGNAALSSGNFNIVEFVTASASTKHF